jgi:predicted porin
MNQNNNNKDNNEAKDNNISEASNDKNIYAEKAATTTFNKYGLAAMINEYNSLPEYSKRKEYMDALTEWYMKRKI